MNPLNRIAGLILSIITGALIPFLQIPYAYYVFAKNRHANGYSWPATLLATATIGHLFAVGTAIMALTAFAATVAWGMKVGFAKGAMAAITLPYTFHIEFQKHLRSYRITELFSQMNALMTFGMECSVYSDAQGDIKPSQLILERDALEKEWARLLPEREDLEKESARLLAEKEDLKKELARLLAEREALENPLSRGDNIQRQLQPQDIQQQVFNKALLDKIDALPAVRKPDFSLLTEAEIIRYKKAIKDLPMDERMEKEKALAAYNDSILCLLTGKPLKEPVTVILSLDREGNEKSLTYDSNALKAWIKAEEKNNFAPKSGLLLKDLAMYRGYNVRIINFVNEVREAANKQLSPAIKNPRRLTLHSLFQRKPPHPKVNTNDNAFEMKNVASFSPAKKASR